MAQATDTTNDSGKTRLSGKDAVEVAKSYLVNLTGCRCETVAGLARTDKGWAVTVEVLELERIPRTTDILASYVVELDGDGELIGYERVSRYNRSQVSER